MRGRILIVDDDRQMCDVLEAALPRRGFQVTATTSAQDAFARMAHKEFDAVVTDLNMQGMNGLDLCQRIVANRPDVPVIVITAYGSMDSAVAAIRAGAYDFVTKPFETEHLALALDRAVQLRSLRGEVRRLRDAVCDHAAPAALLGDSPPMLALRQMMARLADTDASVLITGETGTGKEIVARGLHEASRRRDGPFVAVNCAALPEPLLESELFGHVRGAFTDAHADRTGLFVRAAGGTLLLDEVGDMPTALQARLLRALQDRRVRPVGADAEVEFDARLIAATNRNLESDIAEGRFREDLYFRLNVVQIELPPLRARGNDVLLLAQHFLARFARRSGRAVRGISSAAADRLLSYVWPGNVRELENCIERAVAVTAFEDITVEDLPERIRDYQAARVPLVGDHPADLAPLEEIERRYILRVLDAVGGNKSTAAQVLGLDRKTLYRKLGKMEPGARTQANIE